MLEKQFVDKGNYLKRVNRYTMCFALTLLSVNWVASLCDVGHFELWAHVWNLFATG